MTDHVMTDHVAMVIDTPLWGVPLMFYEIWLEREHIADWYYVLGWRQWTFVVIVKVTP